MPFGSAVSVCVCVSLCLCVRGPLCMLKEKEHKLCVSLSVCVCCGYHVCEFIRECSSVDAYAGDLL